MHFSRWISEVASTAPQAQQVTDRFHLLLNLLDMLIRLFERKHEQLKHLASWEPAQEERTSQTHEARAESVPVPALPIILEPKLSPVHEAQHQFRRQKRKERYDEVIRLHEQGVSQVAIATLLGLDRNTVHRYITAPAFPEIVRPKRASLLDPYKQYLLERWATGQCTASSLRPLRRRPEWMQAYQQQKALQAQGKRLAPLSAHEAAWLFICNPRKLKLRQVCELESLRLQEEELASTYQLVQDFRTMVTQRQVSVLPRWLGKAQACGIPELKSFVAGIYRDYDAVRAEDCT